jgi:glutaredoxin 3
MGSLFSQEKNQIITGLDFIQDKITSNDIFVFSKSTCFYCDKAKELLNNHKLEYKYLELDNNENCPDKDCSKLTKELINLTKHKTVPQIFINGCFIGGFNDLNKLFSSEIFKLDKLKKISSKI